MLKVERLGVKIFPPKGKDEQEYFNGRKGEYAVYNPGMVLCGDKVHMLYRQSRNRTQEEYDKTLGAYKEDSIYHAVFTPNGDLLQLCGEAIPTSEWWDYSGAQDPRVVLFEGRYIISYCGFNVDIATEERPMKARMGFAETKDFRTFKKLGFIDLPQWDKDHFIFPERINGKVCLVHRIEPDIYMDFFDSIEDMLDPKSWSHYYTQNADHSVKIKPEFEWEKLKIGGSVPPIKTEDGWLFIYHGVTKNEREELVYCAGCCLLDLHDPTKVIARLKEPLLYPSENYELYGDVNNVVFPVGAYIHEGYLYVSYGAADKYVAMARVKLEDLMREMKENV